MAQIQNLEEEVIKMMPPSGNYLHRYIGKAIQERLDDKYISTFNDPTCALETTQSNQTYTFKQSNEAYGDVSDERNLSPDWNPNYFYKQEKGITYFSTDELQWSMLEPTKLEELVITPDLEIASTTTQSNDYVPTSRQRYMKSIPTRQIQQLQTNQGKVTPYASWRFGTRSSGHAQ